MSAMLVTFAAFSISSIFSLRAISSGVRFRILLMNKNLHCRVLFYTTLEVYTKFRIVSQRKSLATLTGYQRFLVPVLFFISLST